MRGASQWVGLLVVGVVSISGGCRQQGFARERDGRVLPSVVDVRDIRVLLVDRATEVRVRVDRPFTLRTPGGELLLRRDRTDWIVVRTDRGGGVRFGDRLLGQSAEGGFDLIPEPGSGAIQVARRDGRRWAEPRRYPGILKISTDHQGRLRVVNVVDIETYVACVLPGELFPHFHREAYRAQAVAARTYALYQMALRNDRAYDVNASHLSQVYLGLQSGKAADRAREAANYTRGVVATWSSPAGERIFCTFYSSCCGGVTQGVTDCRTDIPGIPPLAGGVRCDCLTIARGKSYRWPTVRLAKSDVTSKLVARYPKLRTLGRIEQIEVAKRAGSGRPTMYRLIGGSGRSHDIMAEDFRLAVGSMTLRSTNCRLANEPEHFVFSDGKGFGHGMGMCQWGMQSMARQGRRAAEILKHYYPTANLTRAY